MSHNCEKCKAKQKLRRQKPDYRAKAAMWSKLWRVYGPRRKALTQDSCNTPKAMYSESAEQSAL